MRNTTAICVIFLLFFLFFRSQFTTRSYDIKAFDQLIRRVASNNAQVFSQWLVPLLFYICFRSSAGCAGLRSTAIDTTEEVIGMKVEKVNYAWNSCRRNGRCLIQKSRRPRNSVFHVQTIGRSNRHRRKSVAGSEKLKIRERTKAGNR